MGVNDAGVPGRNLPASEDHLMRRLADLERAYRELGPSVARSFQPVIDRLDAADVAMAANVAAIAANVASINDLLTHVVKVQSIYLDARNFALGTGWTILASQAITVPAGFTSALVTVTGQVGCYNPHTTGGSDGAGSDFLLCRPYVGAVTGNALGAQFPGSNWWGNAVTLLSTVLSGLSGGGTFGVGVQASIDYTSMPAYAANEATLSGNIQWFR